MKRRVEMKPVLETARLVMREMSLADLDFIVEMLAHPEVMRFWPKCYDRDEAADWVRRQQARYTKDGVGYWLVLELRSCEISLHRSGQGN